MKLCDIGIHDHQFIEQNTETRERDKGACIETIEEKINHYKCKKCGKEKKKINKYWKQYDTQLSKVKDREITNREWKNRQNDTE